MSQKTVIGSVIAFLWVTSGLYAQTGAPKKVSDIIKKDSTADGFGIVVLENMGGNKNITTLGSACRGKVVTGTTIFNIASCTKTYIATLILMLQEEGKIQIDSPVNKYIQVKELTLGNDVTVKNLLNHTSGLPDFAPSEDYIGAMTDSLRLYDRKEIFSYIAKKEGTTPNTTFTYNNVGYTLLGLIAEKVTQQPLDIVLEKYIFQKLKLKKTFFHYPIYEKDIACPGFELLPASSGKKINYLNMDNLSFAAGNIYTTATELDLFLRKLFIEKTLITENSLTEMLSPFKFSSKNENGMGLGVFVSDVNGTKMLSHTGRYLMGYTSAYACFPESNYSVVILRNNIILDNSNKTNLSNKILMHLMKQRLDIKP